MTGRWRLAVFLLLATTLNYLDRQTISILAPVIQREMRLDNESLGWLFAGFYYAYTVAQFGAGWLLDRSNLLVVYGAAVAAWSAVAALTGLANGFASLLGFRVLLGVMESMNWPAATRMVALGFPPSHRSFANGFFTSGTSIGAVIAPSLILGISALAGWRASFAAVGALGLAWIFAWSRFDPALPTGRPPRATVPYGRVLRNLRFWRVFVITISINPALYFLLNWLPTYLSQQLAIADARALAWMLTAAYLSLDAGNLAAGGIVLLVLRRGAAMRTARRLVFSLASGLSLAAVWIPGTRAPGFALALICCVACSLGLWVSMYLTLAQEVDDEAVATVAGLLGGSGALAGAIAMWAVGRISAHTGSFAIPMFAVTVAALIATFAGWSASPPETAPALPPPAR